MERVRLKREGRMRERQKRRIVGVKLKFIATDCCERGFFITLIAFTFY